MTMDGNVTWCWCGCSVLSWWRLQVWYWDFVAEPHIYHTDRVLFARVARQYGSGSVHTSSQMSRNYESVDSRTHSRCLCSHRSSKKYFIQRVETGTRVSFTSSVAYEHGSHLVPNHSCASMASSWTRCIRIGECQKICLYNFGTSTVATKLIGFNVDWNYARPDSHGLSTQTNYSQ